MFFFYFFYIFCMKHFSFYEELILPDFNENWISSKDSRKSHKYQISLKSE